MNKSCFKVFLGNYQKSVYGIFLIFYMKLQQHKDLEFFAGVRETFFWSFLPKRAQNEVFKVLYKKNARNVSDFLHEVTATWRLKFERNYFLWNTLFWSFGVKKKGPKWTFSSFVKNQCRKLFRFFCIKIKQHKGFKLTKNGFFRKNLALGF